MTAVTAINYNGERSSHYIKYPSSDEETEECTISVNPNSLKQTQLMIAPTRRQQVIEKRRVAFHLKKKTEVTPDLDHSLMPFLVMQAFPR